MIFIKWSHVHRVGVWNLCGKMLPQQLTLPFQFMDAVVVGSITNRIDLLLFICFFWSMTAQTGQSVRQKSEWPSYCVVTQAIFVGHSVVTQAIFVGHFVITLAILLSPWPFVLAIALSLAILLSLWSFCCQSTTRVASHHHDLMGVKSAWFMLKLPPG